MKIIKKFNHESNQNGSKDKILQARVTETVYDILDKEWKEDGYDSLPDLVRNIIGLHIAKIQGYNCTQMNTKEDNKELKGLLKEVLKELLEDIKND